MRLLFFTIFLCNSLNFSYEVVMKFSTIGYSTYTIVSITENMKIEDFSLLLEFYGKLASSCNDTIIHSFYFGVDGTYRITGSNIQPNIEKWISDKILLQKLYNYSIRNTSFFDYDNGALVRKAKFIIQEIEDENRSLETVLKKKIINLLTDNLTLNQTSFVNFNEISNENAEIFIMTTMSKEENFTETNKNVHIFQVDFDQVNDYRKKFCGDVPLTVYSNIDSPKAYTHVYVQVSDSDLNSNLFSIIAPILGSIANGTLTKLGADDIYANFINVHIFSNGNDDDIAIHIPWIGNQTHEFIQNGIQNLHIPIKENKVLSRSKRIRRDEKLPKTCGETSNLYENFVNDLVNSTKIENAQKLPSFFTLYINEVPECLKDLIIENAELKQNFLIDFQTIASSLVNPTDLYFNYIKPLKEFFLHPEFFQVVQNQHPIELPNVASGTNTLPPNPLVKHKKVHRESWELAWEQFFTILFLCTSSALILGTVFYYRRKRDELLKKEIYKDGALRRASRDFLKHDSIHSNRLCWEIHHERVHIDREFPVGEGNNNVVYLGKLKGKAPIMQWINLTEMKQFQDCAVAVRVPRRFDIEEEKQLEREINAMKVIKHHDYVAVLLGWTNKNNLVCTILELTHTNLMKYLKNLKESMNMDTPSSLTTASMIPYKQYLKIIIQITDAMAYIASKGLVHRDLSARNILLTTGLRPKVSGFSFCSLVGDESFHPSKSAFSWLSLQYMAIEAILDGRFSEGSDVWSFGMILYEMYSLGEEPFGNMKPDVLIRMLKNGERPRCPEFSTEEIYSIMSKCWYRYPERRPSFVDLKNTFQQILERQYENPAFEFEFQRLNSYVENE